MDPLPGDRIVVRYRLGAGGPADWRTAPGAQRAGRDAAAPDPALVHSPALSDVTGFLIERNDDELLVERDGARERIPAAAITSLRRLSATPVRNSEIRALERALTEATPAAERVELDGWILSASPDAAEVTRPARSAPAAEMTRPARSAPGAESTRPARSAPGAEYAPRANAAVPLAFGASPAALTAITAWYLDRGLPARVVVPERLLRIADVTGSGPGTEYEVLVDPTGDAAEVPGADRAERLRLRSNAYRLHHTFAVVDLDQAAGA
ncbi:GNAT family N-acetyltransferase, cg3035/Rv0428c family [Gordonia iterans]|uniref:GNAT family N-acetyltransferase, cg3035/Rv0428c family n=1 Tax=Gordonia iterans TaxID=1004901 RepID=UPI00131E05B6|nr:hypothetical protein [Gordonia iterans]